MQFIIELILKLFITCDTIDIMSENLQILDFEGDWDEFHRKRKAYVNGVQPHDLQLQCLALCQQFLAGPWTNLSVEDIIIQRLTSGLINQTYLCKTKTGHFTDNDNESQVVIRLYGLLNRVDLKTFELSENKMDEGIVALMASEIGISPKIYGLFKTGQIMKYYPVNNGLILYILSKVYSF